MAAFEEHCEDCVKELGKPYEEVHRWLDELFRKVGPKHRSIRHHNEGIEEVRAKWGDEAAKAAEIHIKKDCYGVVPTRREAEMWSIFGPPAASLHGKTYLTDEAIDIQYKDKGEKD